MSEEVLIQYCAPTLAGLKTGNLFTYTFSAREEMHAEIRRYNRILAGKKLCIIPMRYRNGKALLYLYRPDALRRDISAADTARMLEEAGYGSNSASRCIRELIRRLESQEQFPHEIGLFLGYPPEDVRGFIEQKAGNYKMIGTWKVYGDVEKAKRTFQAFRSCTARCRRQWQNGASLEQLASEQLCTDRRERTQNICGK